MPLEENVYVTITYDGVTVNFIIDGNVV